ncbi:MAG: hypothetical protein ACRCS8_02945 [Brevinema sp.]
MIIQIFLLLLVQVSTFSQETTNSANADPVFQEFQNLRDLHLGGLAAKSFSAELNHADAKKLLGDKIKGDYRVEVKYHANSGVEFLVKDNETFYERALSQHASYINMMLLPLLATLGYERLQDRFKIQKVEKNNVVSYYVSYQRGDVQTVYQMRVGALGLVDRVIFVEDRKKNFAADITWVKFENVYIPKKIRTISYEGAQAASSFEIDKISLR